MTTQEVANQLVAYCREGKFDEAYKVLFHQDAESIEPPGSPSENTKGLGNMLAKSVFGTC